MMGPRRFVLQRDVDETGISGTGVVAEGIQFSDGVVSLRWLVPPGSPGAGSPTSVVFHDNGIESVEKIHGHGGKTQIVWLDDEETFWAGLVHKVELALNEAEDANGGDYVLLSNMAQVAVDTMRRDRDLSNTSIGGRKLTWAELAVHNEERARRAEQWAQLVSDLDRCEHGRHEGDDCSSCGGPSHGNPILNKRLDKVDGRIGYTLSGRPIVFPADWRERGKVEAWLPDGHR